MLKIPSLFRQPISTHGLSLRKSQGLTQGIIANLSRSIFTSSRVTQAEQNSNPMITDVPFKLDDFSRLPLQINAQHSLALSLIPKKTEEELNIEMIKRLQLKADMMKKSYARIYQHEVDFPTANSPVMGIGNSKLVFMTDVPRVGGNTFGPDAPTTVIDETTIREAEKALKGRSVFSDINPKAHTDKDGKPIDPAVLRKQRQEARKVSPFMAKLNAHYQLTKPRISAMVTVTAWWGYLLTYETFNLVDFSLLTGGTLALSITASIINQIRETDVDAKMVRTMGRPLVTGIITPSQAKVIAASYFVAGSALLAPLSPIVAALGILNVGLYAGIYTSLKRTTPLNTEVGALVGAIPPIMGYFAGLAPGVAWSHDLITMLWPAAVMFAWQMQHVMLICMRRSEDYNNSGLVMQCLNDRNLVITRAKGVAWCVISTAVIALPYFADWANISHVFMIYFWALYSGYYAKSALSFPLNQKGLLLCLYVGYLLLGTTVVLSLQSKKRSNIYDHLILNKK